jgi:guanine deaminase
MSRQAYRGAVFHFLDDPAAGGTRFFDDGVLIVENGRVVEASAWDEDVYRRLKGAPVVHFPHGLIVPGFVDCHVHYPQIDIVASPGGALLDWLSHAVFPAEARFRHEDVAAETARFFLDEMMRNGVTSALVFATVHKVSVEALFAEAAKRNLRLIAGKVLMDAGAPPDILDTAETGYMESRALIRDWQGKGRLGYAVTPRFALTSTPEELEAAGRLVSEYPDVLLHTHLSENADEVKAVHRAFPDCADYLAVYEKFGLVSERSVFAHCVHLSPDEWARFERAGAAAAFCPDSNLFLGSGLFDIEAAAGARIGLASDVGAGTTLSPFAAMAAAYRVCRLKRRPMDAFRLFYLAGFGAARVLRIDDHVGNFTSGKEADFAVLDADRLPLLARRLSFAKTAEEKLFAFAMLGDDRAVARTYVAGDLAYERV